MAIVPNGNRAEDKDFWARFDLLTSRYKLVVWVLLGLMMALGFDFKTPRTYYREVEKKVSDVEARVGAVEAASRSTDDKIDVLLRFQCIDASVSDRERQVARIDCEKLLGTNPQ